MQFEEANNLNKSTTQHEKESCEHSYEKEYYLSASTGDYVCTKCGDALWESDYLEWRKKNT